MNPGIIPPEMIPIDIIRGNYVEGFCPSAEKNHSGRNLGEIERTWWLISRQCHQNEGQDVVRLDTRAWCGW